MPPWLSALLGIAALALTASSIIGRWGGRAARQDVDARTVEETARAVHRHDVADTATEGAIKTLTATMQTFGGKLDQALAVLGQQQVTQATMQSEARADRDRLARLEAESAALRKEIHDVDERQSTARHAMRGEIHTGMATGVGEGIKLLAELVREVRKDRKRGRKADDAPKKRAA